VPTFEGTHNAVIPEENARCQGPVGTERRRSVELNAGGHQNCAVVAMGTAQLGGLVQGHHSFAGGGLGESDAVAGGEHDVGVV
jgi:hypothetical protein